MGARGTVHITTYAHTTTLTESRKLSVPTLRLTDVFSPARAYLLRCSIHTCTTHALISHKVIASSAPGPLLLELFKDGSIHTDGEVVRHRFGDTHSILLNAVSNGKNQPAR